MQSFLLMRWKIPGFTLVATFMAILISGLVVGGLTRLWVTQPRLSEAQDVTRDMVQNTSIALEVMTRELRMAGYNPTGASFDGVTYAPTQLHIRADLNGNGDTDDPDEDIRYIYDAETQQIMRVDCAGPAPLAEHIQVFTLTGLDAQGRPTTVPAHVRQLRITVTARDAAMGPQHSALDRPRTYTLTTLVNLRNASSAQEHGRG